MDLLTANRRLRVWDERGFYVFSHDMLRQIFRDDSEKAFNKGLARLVKAGILEHACRGIYLNPAARSHDSYAIEHIVILLRPTDYNYISLESALSEYGVISQIPMDTLTLMTTGTRGKVKTSRGVIEFTHTARRPAEILDDLKRIPGRPLRVASVDRAWRDLLRVRGRELAEHLVDQEELRHVGG